MDMNSIGQRIRQRRREMGWSQENLAEKYGRNQSRISDIEKGETILTIDDLMRMAQILDRTVSWLIGEDPEQTRVNLYLTQEDLKTGEVLIVEPGGETRPASRAELNQIIKDRRDEIKDQLNRIEKMLQQLLEKSCMILLACVLSG